MSIKVGVIPAGGKGMRAYPRTTFMPKVMFRIAGKPVLLRNIEIMRDKLGIKEIYVIIGYKGWMIKNYFGDGSKFGVKIKYICCQNPSIGLARGLLLAKEYVKEKFICILGDEVYIGSNHEIVKHFNKKDMVAACCIMQTDDPKIIAKNYTVEIKANKIIKLIEKPKKIESNLFGTGTYIFTPEIFKAIENTPVSKNSGKVELTDAIGTLAKNKAVYPIFLKGDYQNINFVEDYNYANYLYRSAFFKNTKVSLIIPAYNEEQSIAQVIRDFKGKVNEIFVVDNSSKDKTREIALKEGARVETVKLKGYGDTISYGFDNAKGDILVLVEADHSFRSKDLGKFLEYMKDADMVIGTRTTRQLIEQGANMDPTLRWGNVFVGKFLEILYWRQEPRFTDVGCSYRAIWKEAWKKMRPRIIGTGPEFSPEMMIEALRSRMRVIEIPVSYYNRYGGESKHSEGIKKFKTGIKMLKIMLKKRFLY